jgi:hypothetical protein
MGLLATLPCRLAGGSNFKHVRYSSIMHRSIEGEAGLHSSPRIIHDEGHDRQGHVARTKFARYEKSR